MKNIKLNKEFKFLKKYNYDYNEVIGVKNKEKYILYAQKKLIRIYRKSLKSKALLSTYIPIEQAIFYNFEIDKNILEKVDIDEFIETKVYEEAGVDDAEKYLIKYKIIDSLKSDKKVTIESVIVSEEYIKGAYKNIVEETGYIDYISFPAFAYKALYEEKIIKKANDLFVVFLYDKVFLTFYSEGELLSIITISSGLNKIYEKLEQLKIKNFDNKLFEKILSKKGINPLKYSTKEKVILDNIKMEFHSLINILNVQIDNIVQKYNLEQIERVFVISEYGKIDGLEEYVNDIVGIDTFGFGFYEEYNLDRLAVDPFLFLGMLEAYNAYKNGNQIYNFSIFLRKPTFFYRPSGKLFVTFFTSLVLLGVYPVYLYVKGLTYRDNNYKLEKKASMLRSEISKLKKKYKILQNEKKKIVEQRKVFLDEIKEIKKTIFEIYQFKYGYMPKSAELVDITKLLNINGVYLDKITYNNGEYILDVFSIKDSQIPDLINGLVKAGFDIDTDGVYMKDKKYYSTIRIKE